MSRAGATVLKVPRGTRGDAARVSPRQRRSAGAPLFFLTLCVGIATPAAGQTNLPSTVVLPSVPVVASPIGLRAAGVEAGWMSGMFVGGQGFNPDRARLPDPGFRLSDHALAASSSTPRVGPPPDPASASQAGAFVGYRGANWMLSSGIRQGVGESAGGTRLDLGANYGFNVTPRHLITLSGRLTLGASTPLAPYYGAYGGDAFWRAGYRAGEPGAGLRLSWLYSFDRNVYFATTLGYDRAYGEAEGLQGPDRNTTTFGTTFGYRW